jgi:dethiobiotin synthetase
LGKHLRSRSFCVSSAQRENHDAELLLAASTNGLTIDEINPLWLKTPAAPLTAAQMEEVEIDIDLLLAALRALQQRVHYVFVEGVGGWLVPIRADYFISDLAAEMGFPVLVVAQNRLGCLNHTMLTVRSIANQGLHCAGIALNRRLGETDVAVATNAQILAKIVDIPVLAGLTENVSQLPASWRRIIESTTSGLMSPGRTQM